MAENQRNWLRFTSRSIDGNIRSKIEILSSEEEPNPKSRTGEYLLDLLLEGDDEDPKISSNPKRFPQTPADISFQTTNPNSHSHQNQIQSVNFEIDL